MKLTITEMKERNPKWFDKTTMRFFGTRIETRPNTRNMFITSETTWDGSERRYTVRGFNTKNNLVETLSEFLEFDTLDEAKQYMKQL